MLRPSAPARTSAAACAVAVALVLLTAASAFAGASARYPADGAAMQRAYGTALKHWGATPCGGAVHLSWRAMGPEYNAVSEWLALDPRQPSTYSDCNVVFNDAIAFTEPRLCTVMVHEIGHLLGRRHTHTRGDVMSEYYEGPIAACRIGTTSGVGAHAASSARTSLRTRRRAACRRIRARTGRVSSRCARLLRASRRTSHG